MRSLANFGNPPEGGLHAGPGNPPRGGLHAGWWLGSAAIVIVLRFLHAASPSYDLGWQLQAAHHLIAGRGLTIFTEVGPDLSTPNVLIPLTYFPAGYSLIAAVLFSAGLGVASTLKVLGAAATALGWWGWARLARSFIGDGIAHWLWKRIAIAIAVCTPLLFTQPWEGTDIFLWAIVPWVVDYTARASDEHTLHPRRFDWLAGMLCGLAFLMRYASAFLGLYVGVVLLWQSRLRLRDTVSRSIAFGLGLLPPLLLQGYINVFSDSVVAPGGIFTARANVISRLASGVPQLPNANYLWAFWIPGRVADSFYSLARTISPVRLALLLVAAAVLLFAFITLRRALGLTLRDRRLIAIGLLPAIPLFLWGCMTLSAANYLGDLRYFWPLTPLSVLVAYSVASLRNVHEQGAATRLLRLTAALYVIGYVVMTMLYVLLLATPGRLGTTQREKVMGGLLVSWPSAQVSWDFSDSRQFVLSQMQADPDAVLVTGRGAAFNWDPAMDTSRVRGLSCGRLEPRYVEGPVRLLIHTFDIGDERSVWRYFGNSTLGNTGRAACFERLPRRLLRRFPGEGMKVLEAIVPRGQRISLNE